MLDARNKMIDLRIEEVSGVGSPSNGFLGWLIPSRVAKSRQRSEAIAKAVERLRMACGDDDLFNALKSGSVLPWNGVKYQGVLPVAKAAPEHDAVGVAPEPAPAQEKVEAVAPASEAQPEPEYDEDVLDAVEEVCVRARSKPSPATQASR